MSFFQIAFYNLTINTALAITRTVKLICHSASKADFHPSVPLSGTTKKLKINLTNSGFKLRLSSIYKSLRSQNRTTFTRSLYASIERYYIKDCNNYKKRIDWNCTQWIVRCSLRGIYFVFSPPVQRQMKPQPTKQHICKSLQAIPAIQRLQKSCFLAGTLVLFC